MNNPYRELSKINPQPSGNGTGFRQINAGIWCALAAAKLSGPAYQVIMHVIEHTWGYQKQSVRLGYANFRDSTGLNRMAISKGIKQARDAHILLVEKGNMDTRESSEYSINKFYDTWLTSKDVFTHTSKDVLTDTGTVNKKENLKIKRGGIKNEKGRRSFNGNRAEQIEQSITGALR